MSHQEVEWKWGEEDGEQGKANRRGQERRGKSPPSQALCCPLVQGAEHRTTEVN